MGRVFRIEIKVKPRRSIGFSKERKGWEREKEVKRFLPLSLGSTPPSVEGLVLTLS